MHTSVESGYPRNKTLPYQPAAQPIQYSYLGNFQATLSLPLSPPPYRAIIYSYDEFYEIAGVDKAIQQGYHLDNMIRTYQSLGYAVLVPQNRHHSHKSIQGAIQFLKNRKDINNNQIYLVGISEGAILTLLAAIHEPSVRAIVLIAPKNIHDTGTFSLPGIERIIEDFHTPTLLLVGNESTNNDVMSARNLRKLLTLNHRPHTYKEYYVNKRWFWNHRKKHIKEVYDFLNNSENYP